MENTQTKFGLTCASLLILAGAALGVSGLADWGLLTVGLLLFGLCSVQWLRQRGMQAVSLPLARNYHPARTEQ